EDEVKNAVNKIASNKQRYLVVEGETGVPWYILGIIHVSDAGGNFNTHLRNGDPLTARTVHVPAGRPSDGQPPFLWETSAIDALKLMKPDKESFSSIGATLYWLERYNGFGYRRRDIKSPYIWSCTDVYTGGQFVSGMFDPNVRARYC